MMAVKFITDKILSIYSVDDFKELIEIANETGCNGAIRINTYAIQLFFNSAENALKFSMIL